MGKSSWERRGKWGPFPAVNGKVELVDDIGHEKLHRWGSDDALCAHRKAFQEQQSEEELLEIKELLGGRCQQERKRN